MAKMNKVVCTVFLALNSPSLLINVSLPLGTGRVPFTWDIYLLFSGKKGEMGMSEQPLVSAIKKNSFSLNTQYAILPNFGTAYPEPHQHMVIPYCVF